MPETTIDETTPISEEQIDFLTSALDLLSKAEDAFEEIDYTEDQFLNDSAQRWLFIGFAEDAMVYLEEMIAKVIELRSRANGGTLVKDDAILKALGKYDDV